MSNGKYENLEQLSVSRFHEDYSLYGDSLPALVRSYAEKVSARDRVATISDIERFRRDHRRDIDAAFDVAYGRYCDPVLWGHTAASFLDELKRLLIGA